MNKILVLICAISILACKQETKNYVTLSGKISDKNSDSLFLFQGSDFSKTFKVNEDGTFNDTLSVASGSYGLYDGNEVLRLYLKNGYDLNITLNAKQFTESLNFTGNGSETNNYLAKKMRLQKELISQDILDLDNKEFDITIISLEKKLNAFIDENSKVLDSTLLSSEKEEIKQFIPSITTAYKQKQGRLAEFESYIGNPSPNFVNFENVKGGTTSLSDLKGKYVYIDVWATWCGPCIKEIPALKEVEKEFHDKNIQFVSLSVDDGRGFKADTKEQAMELAHDLWKKMIDEKELGGIQLYADNGFKSSFVQAYKINSIPRFILLDPSGNVINADAPRPSSAKLKKVLSALKNI